MVRQTTPTHMAKKLARLLRPERPDYAYLKKVFQHTRALLAVAAREYNSFCPITAQFPAHIRLLAVFGDVG
jgi:uncharacterized protein (DUF1800 family)